MYQARERNILSPRAPVSTDEVFESAYRMLVAIGTFWRLTDDADGYRERLRAFMGDRININPLYQQYYIMSERVTAALVAEMGEAKAYEHIFTNNKGANPPKPTTELGYVQTFVANELVSLRLSLGGFASFGALNYRGYISGANVPGQPIPYRPSQVQE